MEFSKFCCRKQWICSCRMEKKELVVFIPCQQLFLKRENKNKRYFPCKFTQTGQTIKFHIPSSHLPIQKPTVIYKKQAVIKSYPTFPKKALNSIPHSLQEKIKNITTYDSSNHRREECKIWVLLLCLWGQLLIRNHEIYIIIHVYKNNIEHVMQAQWVPANGPSLESWWSLLSQSLVGSYMALKRIKKWQNEVAKTFDCDTPATPNFGPLYAQSKENLKNKDEVLCWWNRCQQMVRREYM